jgi:hypothetical protein
MANRENMVPDDADDERHRDFMQCHNLLNEEGRGMKFGETGMDGQLITSHS